MKSPHDIPLTRPMMKILKEQRLFSGQISEFVFPANTIQGHINRDSTGKAIKNLGEPKKWLGKAISHGFRATFSTICSQRKAELLGLGKARK